MKKWLSLLLAIVMLVSCIPMGAMAAVLSLEQPSVTLENVSNGISVKWNAVEGAKSYQVYRKGPDGIWALLRTVTKTSYQDQSAADGVSYFYRVVAQNGDGLSSNKQYAKIMRLAKPRVKVTNADAGVSVKWSQVEGAKSYGVYRKIPGGSWKSLKSGLTDLSYVDSTAQNASEYVYAVRAFDSTGGSAYASSVQIVRVDQPEATASNTAKGISITWNKVRGVDSYDVYRKVSGGSWQLLSTETGTSYEDSGVQSGVKYFYRVRAKNGSITSGYKLYDSIVRLAQPTVKLSNAAEGICVQWDAVDGAKSYRVYRKVSGGSWKILKKGLTSFEYTDTTAVSGKNYYYSVCAYNGGNLSEYHLSEAILRIEQPKATVSNSAEGVTIRWDKVKAAESYNVYRKVSGGNWKRISNVTGTSYVDRTAESGVTYFYRVRAKNEDVLSSYNQSAKILCLKNTDVTVSNGNNGVIVKWSKVQGAESYRIYRKVPGGDWKTLKTGMTDRSFTDTTAKSGTTYIYAVRAYGKNVLSDYSSSETILRLDRPVVTADTHSATSIKLQWDAVEGADQYTVYVKTADTDWKAVHTGTGTNYTVKKLTVGQKYSFAVRAVSDASTSARSASVSKKATFPAPSYTVKLKAGSGIEVSWTAVDGAGSYRVYRREGEGSWKTLKTTTSTSYVDTSGTSGVTYEYAVRAFELKKAGGASGIRAVGQTIVYSKIDPSKPMVALTFDDGPSAYTKDILDQLEKYGVHATFFVVGERVSTYASTIKRAYSLGCEIGNHSWSHPNLASISVKTMQSEISRTDEAIEKVIGKKTTLLRPPYGSVDSDVRNYAGKPLIHWSIDTLDWKTRNSSKTISSVLNNVRDGSIVLMHDIYSATRDAAVSLIPTLISRGYQLVTVSEMAAYHGTTLKNGTIYYSLP